MNYRHAFHAGNFADLVKHACVLLLTARLQQDGPLTIIDTHGGAGAYDLGGDMAARSGEAKDGVLRLMSDGFAPSQFDVLKAAVRKANHGGETRFYPGSPLLLAQALRPQDRYVGCELRADDHALLAQTLRPYAKAAALAEDGFAAAARLTPAKGGVLVLIDPPFERADDYAQITRAVAAVLRRRPDAVFAIWTPLKDLETFDALLRDLEGVCADLLIAQTRLRPLVDPMKMNGCAMVFLNAPDGVKDDFAAICGWTAKAAGGPNAAAKLWRTT